MSFCRQNPHLRESLNYSQLFLGTRLQANWGTLSFSHSLKTKPPITTWTDLHKSIVFLPYLFPIPINQKTEKTKQKKEMQSCCIHTPLLSNTTYPVPVIAEDLFNVHFQLDLLVF
jgi:hypothetical protein